MSDLRKFMNIVEDDAGMDVGTEETSKKPSKKPAKFRTKALVGFLVKLGRLLDNSIESVRLQNTAACNAYMKDASRVSTDVKNTISKITGKDFTGWDDVEYGDNVKILTPVSYAPASERAKESIKDEAVRVILDALNKLHGPFSNNPYKQSFNNLVGNRIRAGHHNTFSIINQNVEALIPEIKKTLSSL